MTISNLYGFYFLIDFVNYRVKMFKLSSYDIYFKFYNLYKLSNKKSRWFNEENNIVDIIIYNWKRTSIFERS